MKKYLVVLIIPALLINVSAKDTNLTIKAAISAALQNNTSIKAAQHMVESCSHNVAAAKSEYLPRIDLVAMANKINEPVKLDLNDTRRAIISASAASYSAASGKSPANFTQTLEQSIPSFEKKVLDDTFVRVIATFIQPIFTGFKVSANASVKKLEKEIAEINLKTAKNSVITEVIEDYYRAQLIDQVAQIRKSYLANIEKHVLNAKRLYNNGIMSKANYLRAEVALVQAQRDYKQSLMDRDLAFILLDNATGYDTKTMILSSKMKMLENIKNPDYYTSKAEINNGSLKLLNSKKEMLKQRHKASVGNLLPNIAAVGEYQILQNDLTLVEPKWIVGLTASLNIFSGAYNINKIKAAKAQIEAVNAQSIDVKHLIRTGVKKFYHQCKAAKQDHEALESSEKLAKENLRLYRASFKEGLATSLEVVDAELAFTKIKVDMAKAIFDYNSAYAGLLNICSISQEEFSE